MKKLSILLVGVVIGLSSCGSGKYMMSDEEISTLGYTIEGWNILKKGQVVGTMSTTEWEVYRNHMSREISIKTSFTTDAEMQEIARFVLSKFPNDKIEVNQDNGNTFPQ